MSAVACHSLYKTVGRSLPKLSRIHCCPKSYFRSVKIADMEDVDSLDAQRSFSVWQNPAETQSTVIVGAGIIGCATAYYLSHSGNTKPDTIHLVEATPELFESASGKSGGFLASDC